jgi:hypothetical protein
MGGRSMVSDLLPAAPAHPPIPAPPGGYLLVGPRLAGTAR